MRRYFLATAAVLAFASSAHAQSSDWSGPYLGAHAGWNSKEDGDGESVLFDTNLDGNYGDTVRTAAGANAFSPGFCNGAALAARPGGCPEDDSGFDYGVRLGYDWQFGDFVVGVVAEGSKTNVEDSVSAYSTTPAFYTFTRKLDSVLALRVRGGYAFGDNLAYVTGGAARGEIEHAFFTSNGVNTFRQSSDEAANGYQLGGGFERKLTDDVTLGLEYLYTRLDDDSATVRAAGPAPATNPFILVDANGTDMRRSEDEFNTHSLRVTASYRF